MFGVTFGLYKGELIEGVFEPGKKYLIQVIKRPGYYIIKNVLNGKERIYMDSSRVLNSWRIDGSLLL